MIGNETLCGNLYRLELYSLLFFSPTVNTVSSTKRLKLNEKSYILWHKRLGRISKQRIKRLIKDEILSDLDFSYFYTCVDCIKSKLTTKIMNAKTNRCTEFLGVIPTYICGSFTPLSIDGHKYFITFIDDYFRYDFFELILEKSDSLEAFKAKVELQQEKKIKVVHFDKGDEYYGRYDETGSNLGLFAKFLQE